MSAIQQVLSSYQGSAAWTPADLPDIQEWYRASDLALSNDDPVSTWPDLVGSADMTGAGSARPIYKANAGDPYVEFDGSDDSLVFTRGAALNDFSVFVVVQTLTEVIFDRMFQLGATNLVAVWPAPGVTNSYQAYVAGTTLTGDPNLPAGFFALYFERVSDALKLRVEGVENTLGSGAPTVAIDTSSALGSNPSGGENAHQRIKEFGICSAAVTGANFTSLADYILAEYGLVI